MENITEAYKAYVKEPSDSSRNKVLEESYPVIEKIVARFSNGKVIEKQDLFQEGVFGVMDALKKGYKEELFEHKLYSHIKASILRYNSNSAPVKLNNYAQNKIYKINQFKEDFISKNKSIPTDEEVSAGTGIKTKNLVQFKCLMNCPEEITETILQSDSFVIDLENEEIHRSLLDIIENKLTKQERDIIISKYGLKGKDKMTLDEIGKTSEKKLCKQRIDQIHKAALLKIKEVIMPLV